MARFKVDENLPGAAAQVLREAGHDAATVLDQDLQGSADDVISEACRREQRILLTLDRGYGDPRRHPTAGTEGIIVLRMPSQDRDAALALVRRVVAALEEHRIDEALWIVEPHRIRIRRA